MAFHWPFSLKRNKKSTAQVRAFQAASLNRLTSDWIATNTSIDAEIRGGGRMLRARCRDLERNNDYFRNFLREVETNIIGTDGIRFEAQVPMQRGGKLDEKTNKAIEDTFCSWADSASRCHTAGRHPWFEIERLAIRSIARDGDIGIRFVRGRTFGDSKIPLAIEVLEADMIDDTYNDVLGNGNRVRMGVEQDQWLRPVAYWVHSSHPGDMGFATMYNKRGRRLTRIPADEMILPFFSERAEQSRGFPWAASAIMRLHHMKGREEAEVIAARAGAMLMGFIQTPEGELKGDDVDAGQQVTDFETGVFKKLNSGEQVIVPDTSRDHEALEAFNRVMLRGVAAGLGGSYEGLSKDYSQSNYSSTRQSLLSERALWRVYQKGIIAQLHQRVFNEFLDMATLSGELVLPGYELQPDKYRKVKWIPRGWSWIDPTKEVAAAKEAVLGGFDSISDILAEQGEDFDEKMATIKRERDTAKGLGLVFDSDAAVELEKLKAKAPPPNSSGDPQNP
jgi:lambda family phage portal protein